MDLPGFWYTHGPKKKEFHCGAVPMVSDDVAELVDHADVKLPVDNAEN